jgi:hypothetical protein
VVLAKRGDEDDFVRIAGKNARNWTSKCLYIALDSWDDDSDILARVSRVFRLGY